MKVGSRSATTGALAMALGMAVPGVAWGDALEEVRGAATVQVRAPDVIAPLPPGFPQNGPTGCDDWAEPYENNVPSWGADPYDQFDNWCDGPEDGLPPQNVPEDFQ